MATIEEIINKINQLKSSTEITETLLAEVLDQLKIIEEKQATTPDNSQQEALKKINETLLLLLNKDDSSHFEKVFLLLNKQKNHLEHHLKNAKTNQITIFGGNNAALNYQRMFAWCCLVGIAFLGFKYLPDYFIKKQEQEEQLQQLKMFVETEKMREFYHTGKTKDVDLLIQSIQNNDEAFIKYFNSLKQHWINEHEKATLKQQLEQTQQRLKELN